MEEMIELAVRSSVDGTMQPNLFYFAGADRPLLVGLHTWSCDRFNQVERMMPLAERNRWSLLLPEFRGPNLRRNPNAPDACGSKKAKQDILDAVEYVEREYGCDSRNILLAGGSGGGHMALLMAAYAPELWRAVCSFVPITDVGVWRTENPRYFDGIDACCGEPGTEETAREYAYRSPVTYLDELARATVKIWTGKWDPSVPCHHGLDLYNRLFAAHPEAHVFFEMFDGGHELLFDEAERWLLAHMAGDEAKDVRRETVTG